MLKITPNPDFPFVEPAVLERSDSQAKDITLGDDAAYNSVAEQLASLKEGAMTEEPQEPQEPLETETETTEPEAQETETENIWKKYGIPDEMVKDGKLFGQFDNVVDALKKYEGREKQAGKQAQEIGELRKKVKLVDDLEEKVVTLESQLREIEDTSPIRTSDLIFDNELNIPSGMTAEQTQIAHQFALDKVEEELESRFRKEDLPVPRTPEEFETLATTNPRLYNLAETVRKDALKEAIQMTRDYNSVDENYDTLVTTAVTNTVDGLVKQFGEWGYEASVEDAEFRNFVNYALGEIAKADPSKRGLYWNNIAGHEIPREDALLNFVKQERPDLIRQLSQMDPPDIQIDSEASVEVLEDSVNNLVYNELPKYGVNLDVADTQTVEKINSMFATIWADTKNPMYWKDGKLKESALSTYLWNNPSERDTIISQALAGVESRAQAEVRRQAEDANRKLEEELQRRMSVRPTPSLATDTTGTQSGDTFSVPSPKDYRNNLKMIALAKENGITVDQLYDKVDEVIKTMPLAQRKEYGEFFVNV